jgi:hypothetical protein
MQEPISKKLLSVLLSFLGLFAAVWFPVAFELTLWNGRLQGELGPSEWLIATLKYALPLILIGALMLLGAARCWSRWRLGMGCVELILGIGFFHELQLAFASWLAYVSLEHFRFK